MLTALGLLAELGDLRRFASARELMSFLGLTPSEYSSGDQCHRGHITKAGSRHARRLLIEAAWHYQHAPRVSRRIAAVQPPVPPDVAERAISTQIRLTTATAPSPTTASAPPTPTSVDGVAVGPGSREQLPLPDTVSSCSPRLHNSILSRRRRSMLWCALKRTHLIPGLR
jgi:Transposase IS116/IS110/IS902 family